MSDKELLELAAKAMGHTLYWTGQDGFGESFIYAGPDISSWTPSSGHDKFELGETKLWNPLTDDGDALRLAVKLNMGISIPVFHKPRADVICFRDSGVNVIEESNDPYAATRRAIVRAAAEIGKAMEDQ